MSISILVCYFMGAFLFHVTSGLNSKLHCTMSVILSLHVSHCYFQNPPLSNPENENLAKLCNGFNTLSDECIHPNVYRMSLVRWIQQKRQEHEVCADNDGKKAKDSQAVWKISRLDYRSGSRSSERKSSRFSRSGSVQLFWFDEAAYQMCTRKTLECTWLLLCFDR